ncbi:hypothetical protein DN402_19585 [Streptomyces sp. SW4]|nr:hypothetical protein DN402_19585 [Streptomyces sp. SW4]
MSGPPPDTPYRPRAAATATTANISTSTPAMIRFRVFGSTPSSLTGPAQRPAGDRLVAGLLPGTPDRGRLLRTRHSSVTVQARRRRRPGRAGAPARRRARGRGPA